MIVNDGGRHPDPVGGIDPAEDLRDAGPIGVETSLDYHTPELGREEGEILGQDVPPWAKPAEGRGRVGEEGHGDYALTHAAPL